MMDLERQTKGVDSKNFISLNIKFSYKENIFQLLAYFQKYSM